MVKGVFLTEEEYNELVEDRDKYRDFYYKAKSEIKNNNNGYKKGINKIEVGTSLISEVLGYYIDKEKTSINLK